MSNRKKFENHALNLSKLNGNLLSLEMAARLAIVKYDKHLASKVFTQLPQVKKGDHVEFNAFTNADDLKQTLDKSNKRAPNEYRVDIAAIVNLRDALAHGRTFGFGGMDCLRLLKFSRKQRDGTVEVELAQDMNEAWFQNNIELLNKALDKVTAALDYDKMHTCLIL